MKLAKSLLLGSAAGLAAVVSAQAADLPVRKAAPVDYVRVCSAYGTGFFFIPGTETCLRVTGYVRYESRFADRGWSTDRNTAGGVVTNSIGRGAAFTQFARGAVRLDARTATEYGLLRSYISGHFNGNDGSNTAAIEYAYIQFGGLTAGQIPSFFRPFGNPALNGGGWLTEDARPLIAYTATFGAFSATIAAETPKSAVSLANAAAFQGGFVRDRVGGSVPDIVAALAYRGTGFSVHLNGVLHEIRSNNRFGANNAFVDTKFGYALLAGVGIDLPMIGSGTSFQIQGVYADGATAYASISQAGRRFSIDAAEAYVNAAGGVSTATAWAINARLNHTWAPGISQTVYGTYGQYEAPAVVRRTFAAGAQVFNLQTDPGQFTNWTLGTVVNWSPVAGLTISGDVNYARTEAKRAIQVRGPVGGAAGLYQKSDDRWTATLRIQRDF